MQDSFKMQVISAASVVYVTRVAIKVAIKRKRTRLSFNRDNSNNNCDNVYGAVIIARSLREFIRFI